MREPHYVAALGELSRMEGRHVGRTIGSKSRETFLCRVTQCAASLRPRECQKGKVALQRNRGSQQKHDTSRLVTSPLLIAIASGTFVSCA